MARVREATAEEIKMLRKGIDNAEGERELPEGWSWWDYHEADSLVSEILDVTNSRGEGVTMTVWDEGNGFMTRWEV